MSKPVVFDSQSLKQIVGRVKADGNIMSQYGTFTVRKVDKGAYEIDYKGQFKLVYGGAATQIYGGAGTGGGSTRDNAVFVYLENEVAKIITGDGGGDHTDRDFTFAIYGANPI